MIRFLGVVAALFVSVGPAHAQTRGAGVLPLYLEVCAGTFEDVEARAAALGWLPYEQFALDEKARLYTDGGGGVFRMWRLFSIIETLDFSAVYVAAAPEGSPWFPASEPPPCILEVHGGVNARRVVRDLADRGFSISDMGLGMVFAKGTVAGRPTWFRVHAPLGRESVVILDNFYSYDFGPERFLERPQDPNPKSLREQFEAEE